MVAGSTNAFDRNVSGNSTSIETPCTVDALFISTPMRAKIQLMENAHTMTRIAADRMPTTPPAGR